MYSAAGRLGARMYLHVPVHVHEVPPHFAKASALHNTRRQAVVVAYPLVRLGHICLKSLRHQGQILRVYQDSGKMTSPRCFRPFKREKKQASV